MVAAVAAAAVALDPRLGPGLVGREVAGWSVCVSVCHLLTRSRAV